MSETLPETLQRALTEELTEDDSFIMDKTIHDQSISINPTQKDTHIIHPEFHRSQSDNSSIILTLKSPSSSTQPITTNEAYHHRTAPSPSPNKQATPHQQTSMFIENKNNDCKSDNINFLRIWIQREHQERDTHEVRTVCRKLQTACMIREKYIYTDHNGHFPSCSKKDEDICLNINIVKNALPKKSNHTFEMKHGVFRVFKLKRKKISPSVRTTPDIIGLKARKSVNTQKEKEDIISDIDSDYEEKIEYSYIKSDRPMYNVHSFGEFMKDLWFLLELISNGPAKTFCYQRLQTLGAKFKVHML
eukprot:733892_1